MYMYIYTFYLFCFQTQQLSVSNKVSPADIPDTELSTMDYHPEKAVDISKSFDRSCPSWPNFQISQLGSLIWVKWIFNVKSQKWGWVLTWFLSLVLYGFYAITSNLKNFATMISSGEKLSLVFKIPFLYTYFFIHISNVLFPDRDISLNSCEYFQSKKALVLHLVLSTS